MQKHAQTHAINPFATRYVRPGKLPWLGCGEESLDRLEAKFTQELACRAAIIGPHGTGKSTLLEHLVPRLGTLIYRQHVGNPVAQTTGGVQSPTRRAVIWLSLRRGHAPFARLCESYRHCRRGGLVVIDGFEQLSTPAQWLAVRAIAVKSMGLLVTAHSSVNLATLVQTKASLSLAQQVVEKVASSAGIQLPARFFDERLLASLLEEESGNMREVLMRLYDMATEALPASKNACKVVIHGQ